MCTSKTVAEDEIINVGLNYWITVVLLLCDHVTLEGWSQEPESLLSGELLYLFHRWNLKDNLSNKGKTNTMS